MKKKCFAVIVTPPVLRIPTGLCILDDLKYLSLVEIGTIFFFFFFFDNGAPSWSNDLLLACTFEGIYRNFDIFLVELVIYELEPEK